MLGSFRVKIQFCTQNKATFPYIKTAICYQRHGQDQAAQNLRGGDHPIVRWVQNHTLLSFGQGTEEDH